MRIEGIGEILAELKEEIREKYKAKKIGFSGSYIRGEQKGKSDIDILVGSEEPIDFFFEISAS